MKNVIVILTVAAAVSLIAPSAIADTLEVLPVAALEGSYGLVIHHDNTSASYVQDNTPDGETVYRAQFLFNPNDIAPSPTPKNMRQIIFTTHGANPNSGNFNCPTSTFVTPFRLFLYINCQNCPSQQYHIKGYIRGNWCGEAGVDQVQIPSNTTSKVCVEWEIGSPGRMALAVVGPAESCPTSGGPEWNERTYNNNAMDIQMVRLGTPETNAFGAGETGDMYFDSFESYRTLAP